MSDTSPISIEMSAVNLSLTSPSSDEKDNGINLLLKVATNNDGALPMDPQYQWVSASNTVLAMGSSTTDTAVVLTVNQQDPAAKEWSWPAWSLASYLLNHHQLDRLTIEAWNKLPRDKHQVNYLEVTARLSNILKEINCNESWDLQSVMSHIKWHGHDHEIDKMKVQMISRLTRENALEWSVAINEISGELHDLDHGSIITICILYAHLLHYNVNLWRWQQDENSDLRLILMIPFSVSGHAHAITVLYLLLFVHECVYSHQT